MSNKLPIQNNSQFLVYQTEDGKLKIDVRFEGETVWLAQQQMAELFQTTKQNISLHIQNIYEDQELEREATVKESLTVQREGIHHLAGQCSEELESYGHLLQGFTQLFHKQKQPLDV